MDSNFGSNKAKDQCWDVVLGQTSYKAQPYIVELKLLDVKKQNYKALNVEVTYYKVNY